MDGIHKKVSHTELDGGWNLGVTKYNDGHITAENPAIQTAQLIMMRDVLRETLLIQRQIAGSIESIQHFFHRIGVDNIKEIAREEGRLYRNRRLRRARRDKKKRAACISRF